MSRQASPSTQRPLGMARVTQVWGVLRSTDYARHTRQHRPAPPQPRGQPATVDDATLLSQICAVLAERPFHGEGHRAVGARARPGPQVPPRGRGR